jgi:hut operon positive regulator
MSETFSTDLQTKDGVQLRADSIGRLAVLTVLADDPESALAARREYRGVAGRVGTMQIEKVIAAIETAATRAGLITPEYAEEHALYHAIVEALHGVGRGQLALGSLLRTVGLRVVAVRGPRFGGDQSTWIAVALYGTIGQPVKGNEHEVIGLGIMHL